MITSIAKTENVAILILMVVCAFLCKVILAVRKEDREDRQAQEARAAAAQERNNQVIEKVAEAITQMRVTLASRGYRDDHQN